MSSRIFHNKCYYQNRSRVVNSYFSPTMFMIAGGPSTRASHMSLTLGASWWTGPTGRFLSWSTKTRRGEYILLRQNCHSNVDSYAKRAWTISCLNLINLSLLLLRRSEVISASDDVSRATAGYHFNDRCRLFRIFKSGVTRRRYSNRIFVFKL